MASTLSNSSLLPAAQHYDLWQMAILASVMQVKHVIGSMTNKIRKRLQTSNMNRSIASTRAQLAAQLEQERKTSELQ